jgi:hypothetical protein
MLSRLRRTGARPDVTGLALSGLILILTLSGCDRAAKRPVIEFTQIPAAGEGGPDRLEDIEGTVRDAPPGERIVVYAKAGTVWWVQPLATRPFTSIASNGTWKTSTHLGSEYAAVLVDPGYDPASTMKTLPSAENGVSAVVSKTVGSEPSVLSQTLKFSGYDWYIRHITSDRNGGISYYDPANAWTDKDGALHLRISRDADRWKCSQVTLANHFGYGTYLFTVRDASHLQPAAALVMFTYDDLATEHHREMDIELSRWGDPKSKNGDYVVQPYMFPENKVIFNVPAGRFTHSLRWEPGRATFTTSQETTKGRDPLIVEKNVFTTGIPTPGGEAPVIDFCDFKYSKVPLEGQAEVIVERFQYLP